MKILFVFAAIFLVSFSADPKKQRPGPKCEKWGGVYSSQEAYLKGSLSDSICLDGKGNAIGRGSFDRLVIKSKNSKKIIPAGKAYGYFDGKSKYRYAEMRVAKGSSGYFKVRSTSGITVYSKHSRSYQHSTVNFYYSKTPIDTLRMLTVKNLKADFPNKGFIAEVNGMKDLTSSDGNDLNNLYRKYYR